ncbi:ATP-binding cassette domain-containing protein [Candidatus Poribacteria bacterium]|nr:ATP-binding cassette domain-containing protein [Candidatus Poribacteria bacterium]
MNHPILNVKNLKVQYAKNLVLDIPELDFDAGMIYALVGPNGSGKTTLLKVLNLLLEPTSGEIYFDNRAISKSSLDALEARRQMTLVMQNPILFRTSVYKNVSYGLNLRGHKKGEMDKMVSEILEMVGLSGFENRKYSELSAGEAQRVALARGLVLNPRVLFLDEPTANVDRRNAHIFEILIKKVNVERGTTIIFTTHDLSQAYRLGHKIISLLDGCLIKSSPENILYGKIDSYNGRKLFVNADPLIKLMIEDHISRSTGVYIDPRDVIISVEPHNPSEWNSLPGNITSVNFEDSHVRLTVNVGIELVAIIDRDSYQFPSDIFGKPIYANFKIYSVHAF